MTNLMSFGSLVRVFFTSHEIKGNEYTICIGVKNVCLIKAFQQDHENSFVYNLFTFTYFGHILLGFEALLLLIKQTINQYL